MATEPLPPEEERLEDRVALPSIDIAALPFETEQLRTHLKNFLDQQVDIVGGETVRLGSIKWGVYAFYDYDGEPIYVGQTKESLGTRIRRHLTNQRTDSLLQLTVCWRARPAALADRPWLNTASPAGAAPGADVV